MTRYFVEDSSLTAIANAVRSKTGTTDPLTLDGMAEAVNGLQVGGNGSDLAKQIVERSITEISDVTITSVVSRAFYDCYKLTSVNLPACTSVGEAAVYNCARLTSVNLPACTSIGKQAFRNCSSIESIVFPACTSLNDYAFEYCYKLTSVNLPACTSIGKYAFSTCSSLVSVRLSSESVCTLSATSAFYACTHILGTGLKDGYIYVPDNLVESYKADSNWSTYATQIKPLSYYDTAVYSLGDNSYASSVYSGLILTTEDDNKITITNNTGSARDAVVVNLTNPSVFTTSTKSDAVNNIAEELFTLTTGDIVNAEVKVVDNPSNLTVAMGWRKTGTSESFSEITVADSATGGKTDVATTADASISCGFLYIDGTFANNSSITLEVNFKVNGQRYF